LESGRRGWPCLSGASFGKCATCGDRTKHAYLRSDENRDQLEGDLRCQSLPLELALHERYSELRAAGVDIRVKPKHKRAGVTIDLNMHDGSGPCGSTAQCRCRSCLVGEDIGKGAALTVLDGSADTVGVGTLSAGKMTIVTLASRQCVFDIEVPGVLAGKNFYSLRVGDHDTNQLAEADFKTVEGFTLGKSQG
jgi:hypothetical protein